MAYVKNGKEEEGEMEEEQRRREEVRRSRQEFLVHIDSSMWMFRFCYRSSQHKREKAQRVKPRSGRHGSRHLLRSVISEIHTGSSQIGTLPFPVPSFIIQFGPRHSDLLSPAMRPWYSRPFPARL